MSLVAVDPTVIAQQSPAEVRRWLEQFVHRARVAETIAEAIDSADNLKALEAAMRALSATTEMINAAVLCRWTALAETGKRIEQLNEQHRRSLPPTVGHPPPHPVVAELPRPTRDAAQKAAGVAPEAVKHWVETATEGGQPATITGLLRLAKEHSDRVAEMAAAERRAETKRQVEAADAADEAAMERRHSDRQVVDVQVATAVSAPSGLAAARAALRSPVRAEVIAPVAAIRPVVTGFDPDADDQPAVELEGPLACVHAAVGCLEALAAGPEIVISDTDRRAMIRLQLLLAAALR